MGVFKKVEFLYSFEIRCSCSAPDEMDSRELENLLRMQKGIIILIQHYLNLCLCVILDYLCH